MTLGWYPSAADALMIFFRVSGATLEPSVNVRDTADIETPTRSATWRAVTLMSLLLTWIGGNADYLTLRFCRKKAFEVVIAFCQQKVGFGSPVTPSELRHLANSARLEEAIGLQFSPKLLLS